jgi:hypothetical protein
MRGSLGLFLLTQAACGSGDCLRVFVEETPTAGRWWRGASAQLPDERWGEVGRFTRLQDQPTLDDAWSRFGLADEIGVEAPELVGGAIGLVYRAERSGSCDDFAQIASFVAETNGQLVVAIVRRDVCAICAAEEGGFYELWLLKNDVTDFDLGSSTPVPCDIGGPCYAE